MDQVSLERCVQLLPKASDKLRISVGDYHLNIVIGVNMYEVGGFGELIYDYPD
jgi:hypothetical protein